MVIALAFVAGGGLSAAPVEARSPDRAPRRALAGVDREDIAGADLSVLLIGNSHSATLPAILTEMFRRHDPKLTTCIHTAPGFGFLVDHARSESTRELLQRGPWDVVILQGQKYSTTGRYSYPYDGAFELSELALENGSRIIMFPEWSRRQDPEEYLRIDKIHREIADKTGADVAPIGISWVRAAAAGNRLKLLAADGNHATRYGSYLNASVFFSMLTGQKVPALEGAGRRKNGRPATAEQLDLLGDVAWRSVLEMKSAPGDHSARR